MARGFRLLPAGLEEAQFKRVPEGWLFTTANPWVFAPRRTYLLNEAQKPAIAARVRRGRYIRLILLAPMMLLLAAAFILAPSLLNFRSPATWLVVGAFRRCLHDRNHRQRQSSRSPPASRRPAQLAEDRNDRHAVEAGRGHVGRSAGGMLVAKSRARQQAPQSDLTIEGLAARLQRMELRWSLAAGALGMLLAIGGIGGTLALLFHQSSAVSAQSFAVRNGHGDLAAFLLETGGLPSLHLYDSNKKLRALLSVAASGQPSFTLYDGEKKSRAIFVVNNDGNPFLLLEDANGKVRWSAFVNDRGPYLGLSDANGIVRWSVLVDDGGAHVRTFDAAGKEAPTQK